MTLQQMVGLVLAGMIFGAFGGPVAAVFGLWLVRRNERRRWLVIPVRAPGKGGAQ